VPVGTLPQGNGGVLAAANDPATPPLPHMRGLSLSASATSVSAYLSEDENISFLSATTQTSLLGDSEDWSMDHSMDW